MTLLQKTFENYTKFPSEYLYYLTVSLQESCTFIYVNDSAIHLKVKAIYGCR